MLHLLADSESEDRELSGPRHSGNEDTRSLKREPKEKFNSFDHHRQQKQRTALHDASSSARLNRMPPPETGGENKDETNGHSDSRESDIDAEDAEDHTLTPGKVMPYEQNDVPHVPSGPVDRPSESALLRDLPFTLQGLSSTNLAFTSTTTLELPKTLPLPIISILHTLAEPSLLYRSLTEFVKSRDEGLIGQSLRSAIGSELRSYLGLIATLEGEIRRAITSVNVNERGSGVGRAGVTLKRCVIWTREATMGLRLMSVMAEESKSECGPSSYGRF